MACWHGVGACGRLALARRGDVLLAFPRLWRDIRQQQAPQRHLAGTLWRDVTALSVGAAGKIKRGARRRLLLPFAAFSRDSAVLPDVFPTTTVMATLNAPYAAMNGICMARRRRVARWHGVMRKAPRVIWRDVVMRDGVT